MNPIESPNPRVRAHYDQLLQDLQRVMERESAPSQPASPLYHYCSFASFEGILRSGEFWFTSLYTMRDDPREFGEGFGLSRDILQNIREREGDLGALFCNPILGAAYEDEVRKRIEVYSASLGARDDEPQWVQYADNGCGVSFGLAGTMFEPRPLEEHAPNEVYNVAVVCYERVRAEALLREAIELTYARFKRALEDGSIRNAVEAEQILRLMHAEMHVRILQISATTKRSCFSHEKETRLLTYNHLQNPKRPILHRNLNGHTVNYVRIAMPLREPGNIPEVLIGRDAQPDVETRLRAIFGGLGIAPPKLVRSLK
jgi:hypothetical protein